MPSATGRQVKATPVLRGGQDMTTTPIVAIATALRGEQTDRVARTDARQLLRMRHRRQLGRSLVGDAFGTRLFPVLFAPFGAPLSSRLRHRGLGYTALVIPVVPKVYGHRRR